MGLISWAFQDMRKGSSFLALSGYAQWYFIPGPFRIRAMVLHSWAFQDMRNGTWFLDLSGYEQGNVIRGYFKITQRDFLVGLSGYAQWYLVPGPFRV
jgi:hypothetical protein